MIWVERERERMRWGQWFKADPEEGGRWWFRESRSRLLDLGLCLNHHLSYNEAWSRWLWVRSVVRGGSDRPFSSPPTLASPPPPPKRRRSSSDWLNRSFCLGIVGFCWGLSCRSYCLGLETVRVYFDFEWSCCLGLEIARVVLVGNEWESSGSINERVRDDNLFFLFFGVLVMGLSSWILGLIWEEQAVKWWTSWRTWRNFLIFFFFFFFFCVVVI